MTDRILDIIGELASAFPFLLFLAFWIGGPILRKLTGRQPASKASPQRPQQAERPNPLPSMAPMPLPVTTRREPAPAPRQWGGAFDRSQQSRDDEALEWGSAFSARGKDGEALKWASAFDSEREEAKWGFDETEWGGGFGPKKESEPKITVG